MERIFGYSRILATGVPAPLATITVYQAGTETLATLYDDNLSPPTSKANPFTADANGFFYFYTTEGPVDVRFSGGGIVTPYTWGAVPVDPTYDVSDFGAVGDGTTDDKLAIQAAIDRATTGGVVRFGKAKTYSISGTLAVKTGVTLELNGSTLLFDLDSAALALQMRNYSTVRNGTISCQVGVWAVGSGGDFGSPIVIGDFAGGSGSFGTGYHDVTLENLIITANRSDGWNGITVFSESYNVLIKNIHFPASATMWQGILTHPGYNDGDTVEYFPRNIDIRNISFGAMTRATAAGSGLISLSAPRNILVENVWATDTNVAVVNVTASDHGWSFGSADDITSGGRGVTIRNVIGLDCKREGIWLDGYGDNITPSAIVYSLPVVVEN
jgi:polygalacturonase